MGKLCSTSTLALLFRGRGPWYTVDRLQSRMTGCLECQTYRSSHRAKLAPDRVEAIWYSTTKLLSIRGRSQDLCILRRCGSESKAWWTRGMANPLPSDCCRRQFFSITKNIKQNNIYIFIPVHSISETSIFQIPNVISDGSTPQVTFIVVLLSSASLYPMSHSKLTTLGYIYSARVGCQDNLGISID